MGANHRPSGRRVSLWVCLGAWSLVCCAANGTPASCPMGPAPRDLNGSHYQPGPIPDAGTTFLSGFVQSFLGTVQPNPFPKALLLELVKDANTITNQDTINKVLRYEVGFLVCVAIGILYIVLMPIVGLFFACCRCCGNCGGRMYQEQTGSINCRRRGLYWATLVITVIILAGNICMFRSNQSLAFSVKQSVEQSSSTLDNLQTYLTAVPQEVGKVEKESILAVEEVRRRLNDIGRLLGEELQKALGGHVNPALDSVQKMSQAVNSTSHLLNHVNATLKELRPELDTLQANLTAVQNSVNRTLQKPQCMGCSPLQNKLQALSLDTSFSVPHLSELQSAVDEVVKSDLDSKVKEGEEFLDTLPQRVTNETRDTVTNVEQELEKIKTQISQFTQDIPLNKLTDVSTQLEEIQKHIDGNSPEVKKVERYSWIVGLILSCVILLVVLCNILGLLLGPVGLRPNADPTERSGSANCGGLFFMAGVGFSFLFSWLFMIVVLLLFLLGGNMYTLVCEPWQEDQLLQILDTPGLIPGFQLSESLGLKTNLTFSGIYEDCNRDRSLWTTLHLQELINLEDLLNVSKYTDEIQQMFDQNEITLPTVTLLSPENRAQLQEFSKMAADVDFSSTTEQLNNVSRTNLNTTADQLDTLANAQGDSTVKRELQQDAARIRRIQVEMETSILPLVRNLNSSIQSLEATASEMNGTMSDVLRKVDAAQDFLNRNTSQIVKSESQKFLDCQLRYFGEYADWANTTITQQVGRCGPVAGALDAAEVMVCSYITESLNSFWFSLGWCLVFLIPSIILSVKLAKFYRRMKHTDVFENHIQMNHFPRATMKPY
ncbi:hypothetical protein AGOR_G00114780 [Albula goreensis]|uniref:Prominin-1-A-like n=1 Tax=Albula goreensis TaxID=1534307 RepID=A0A8T3DH96_9TELE|nr:hypothetical protein AGOR_G00114780 [Albula goreensis]